MKAKIFISYSRRNKEFTRRLVDELKARGYDPWVDWDDIPFSVDWWREIKEAIDGHDAVISVVSYHALTSRVVNKEIKYARDINKRIIPLIVEKVDIKEVVGELYDKPYEMDARDNYKYLRTLNWIYFYRPEDDFMTGVDGIITATEIDHSYLREHTRLLNRAQEWNDSGRSTGFLLMAEELAEAELWLGRSEERRHTPIPTNLHYDYIRASREHEEDQKAQLAAMRRQTRLLRGASVGLVITAVIVVTIIALALQQQLQRLDDVQRESNAVLNTQIAAQNSIAEQGTEFAATESAVRDGIFVQSTEGAETQQAVQLDILRRSTEGAETQQAVQLDILRRSTEGAETQQAVQQSIILRSTEGAAIQQTLIADIDIQRQQSDALRLASEAENALENGDPNLLAISLAIAAERAVQTGPVPERIGRILAEAAFKPGLVRFFEDESAAHGDTVNAVAFSPDGTLLATTSHDRTIRLWNVQTGDLILSLEGHNGRVLSAAFSSDGAMLASGDASNAVILWDVGTGQIIKRLDEHSGRVNDLAFAPDDSQLVSVSSDTQVFVWNVETGERLRTLGSHGSRVTHVAYNPDGSTFITGDANGLIFVWDARTSFFLREENRHAGAITDIAYSADGSMVLTGSQDGRFILWRDFQNEERRIDDVLSGTAITGIAFVNDDTAMIGTDGAELLVWDLTVEPGQNGVVRRLALPGQLSPVVALEASQSRRFAAVAYENRQVALWEMENGAILQRERVQELPVSDLAATAAGQIVFRYADGLIAIWVPERPLTTTTEAELGLVGARLMPDGETALGQDATSLQPVRYNLSTGEVEQTYDLPILTPDTVFSPDGTLALSPLIAETLSLAGSLGDSSAASRVLWDVQTGEEIFTLPGDGFTFSESAALYAISQDNTEIAAVNDLTEILVFDIETGTVVANYPRDRTVTAMVFGPAGGLVVGYTDGGIALRPPENGTWRDLRRHTAPVLSLAISPDKQYIVSGSGDGTVVVWDTSLTEAIRQFVTDTRGISGIVFDASSSTLSTRSVDGNVLLWRFDRDIESVIEWTVDNRFVPVFTRTDCVTFQIPEPCG